MYHWESELKLSLALRRRLSNFSGSVLGIKQISVSQNVLSPSHMCYYEETRNCFQVVKLKRT